MDINYTYCSDKYQYTMGKSFFECGKAQSNAIFNLFYRKAPENNNWAVVSGIDEVIELILNLGKQDLSFYEKFLPGTEYQEFREFLSKLKFTGNVYAMQEGEIVFPNQPIIIIEAPLIEAQILETPILCIMNHQMAVATKASRICRATSKPISEFGSRRAHGPWAATYGAKAAIIAGCVATSNILTQVFTNFPAIGTMSHSYITSYSNCVKGEYQAFYDYIKTHKGESLIMLVDTYDTLKCGVKNAIKAFKNCGIDDSYPNTYGIRLDSGDLAYLSIKAREMLNEAGLHKCIITASNSLDEYLIMDLENQGACIDSYGVGDAIATSKASPCFGNVYKLVEIDKQPVLKRSEDKVKLINPGGQRTYRIIQKDKNNVELYKGDVTCLVNDSTSRAIENNNTFTIRDEFDKHKTTTFNKGEYSYKILQTQVIKNGEKIMDNKTLADKKAYFNNVLNHFSVSEKRLTNPHYYKVDISNELYTLKNQLIESIIKDIENI